MRPGRSGLNAQQWYPQVDNRAQERKLLLPHPAATCHLGTGVSLETPICSKGRQRAVVTETSDCTGIGSRFSPAAFLLRSQEVSASTNCA